MNKADSDTTFESAFLFSTMARLDGTTGQDSICLLIAQSLIQIFLVTIVFYNSFSMIYCLSWDDHLYLVLIPLKNSFVELLPQLPIKSISLSRKCRLLLRRMYESVSLL